MLKRYIAIAALIAAVPASASERNARLTLDWVTDGKSYTLVQRSAVSKHPRWRTIAILPPGVRQYVDTHVNESTEYCYRLQSRTRRIGGETSDFTDPKCGVSSVR
jgi:hypothetical protein